MIGWRFDVLCYEIQQLQVQLLTPLDYLQERSYLLELILSRLFHSMFYMILLLSLILFIISLSFIRSYFTHFHQINLEII